MAWGWPLWNAEASFLGRILRSAQPPAVDADFAVMAAKWPTTPWPIYHDAAGCDGPRRRRPRHRSSPSRASTTCNRFDPADTVEQFPGIYRLPDATSGTSTSSTASCSSARRWSWPAGSDGSTRVVIDGALHGIAWFTVRLARWDGIFDSYVVDGAGQPGGERHLRRRRLAAAGADRVHPQLHPVSGTGRGGPVRGVELGS